MSRRAVLGGITLATLALVAWPPRVSGEDLAARDRFVMDRDAKALAQALGSSSDAKDRDDLALARLAADPAARLEGAAGTSSSSAAVDALRSLDLAKARAIAESTGFPLTTVAGSWIDALVKARGGRDEAAVDRLLTPPAPMPVRDVFPLALLGAALPRDDRELLEAVVRAAVLRAASTGKFDLLPALAEGAVSLDPGTGLRALVLAARALRRAGRAADATALLAGSDATRAGARDAGVRLERALAAWRRGDGAEARREAGALEQPAAWAWAFQALAKAAGAPTVIPAPPLAFNTSTADPDAPALARIAALLGKPTTVDEVAANAASRSGVCLDPAFERAFLQGIGADSVSLAGDPAAAKDALAKALPVLFFKPRRLGERFVDHPVLLRGYDPATDLFVTDEPDLEVVDVVPGGWLKKGRILVAAPKARVAELEPFRASPAAALATALDVAISSLCSTTPEKAIEALQALAAKHKGVPVVDLYLGFAMYVTGLATKDEARRASASAVLRRTAAQPPVLALERFVRTMETSVGNADADAAVKDLLEAARDEGPAAYLDTARFVVLENARRHQEALAALALARDLDPLDVRTLFFRGSTRRLLGDLPGAHADLLRALDRRPDSIAAAEDLASLYLEAGDADKALEVVSRLVTAEPAAAKDPRVKLLRQRAEIRLVRRARSAADLAPLAKSPEAETRKEVAWTLASFESPEAETLLRALLKDGEESVRRKAAQAFQRPWLVDRAAADPAVLSVLAGLLVDASAVVREAAALALGRVETPGAEAALLSRLTGPARDADAAVRVAVGEALSGRDSLAAKKGFVAALSDEDAQVRASALRSLQRLAGNNRGFDPNDTPEKRAAAVLEWERWLKDGGK